MSNVYIIDSARVLFSAARELERRSARYAVISLYTGGWRGIVEVIDNA